MMALHEKNGGPAATQVLLSRARRLHALNAFSRGGLRAPPSMAVRPSWR